MRRGKGIAVVVGASAFVLAAIGQVAYSNVEREQYRVTSVGAAFDQVDNGQLLASCSGSAGTTCTVGPEGTAERTVQTALGASVEFVAERLRLGGPVQFQAAPRADLDASCSWTLPTDGSLVKAHPVGRQIFYTITRTTYRGSVQTGAETSETLMAFEPRDGAYTCFRVRG